MQHKLCKKLKIRQSKEICMCLLLQFIQETQLSYYSACLVGDISRIVILIQIEQQTTKCLPPILVKCLFGLNFNKFRCALFKLAYLNIHFSQTIIAKIKFRN